MNARIAVVLVLLLAVLGGGALLVREQAASRKPAAVEALGQPLLKGLQAAEVAAIAIREPGATLTLQRKDAAWGIAERGGFPADFDKVREFVLKAISLKVSQVETAGEKDRARLKLDDGGTAVEFLGADGKPLARLTAGRKYFRTEPADPAKAIGDGRFVALPGEAQRVYVVSDPLAQASAKSADWVSRKAFAAEKVRWMEVRFPEGGGWRIERAGDNADWKLAGAGAGAGDKLEVTRANAASYSLSLLELSDVAPKDAAPAQTGLDKPVVVTAATFDGLTYTLRVGRAEGEARYATVEISGEPRPEGKDAGERMKALGERLPRERALAGHVLLIPQSKLADFLKPRSELLEKKEARK